MTQNLNRVNIVHSFIFYLLGPCSGNTTFCQCQANARSSNNPKTQKLPHAMHNCLSMSYGAALMQGVKEG